MRSYHYPILILLIFFILIPSCKNEPNRARKLDKKSYEQPLMEANKKVVKTENQHIDDFLRRYKWDMNETGSGLRYMIYENGDGEKAAKGKIAILGYELRLITGDIVYTSAKDGPISFEIGKAEVISGLEEGILFLNVGDKAKFIIPSHLAFGLVGDDNMIPGKTTLIYDITLLKLK